MQTQDLMKLNKQIYDSILQYKNALNKSNDKNQIKLFTSLFKSNWFVNCFPDVHSFFTSIDINHPDIISFIDSVFYTKFIEKSKSITSVINFCKSKKIYNINIESILPDILIDSFNFKAVSILGNPEITLNHIRFLSPAKRWMARSYKNTQVVYPKEKNINNIIQEETLEYFGHNSMQIENYYEQLIEKYNNLKNINCNIMAKELSTYIDKVKENLNQKKYGFYRVPISKIISIVGSKRNFDVVEIIPIKELNYLKPRKCPDFIKICENFFSRNHGVFDHYAEIKFGGINISYLIGEIDSKSYFIGVI